MTFKETLTSLNTIIRKEVVRILRIWIQTLIPPVITISLYFIIFGKLIGSQIGNIGEYTYMQFIVPGLIMMSVITNSYNNVVSSFFGAKFQRNVEELFVSPTPNYIILLGFMFGGISRGILVGGLVTLVALIFTDLKIVNFIVLFSVIFLTASLFSLGGFLNALFAKKFDDVTIIPTFVLTPLTYLGGVFYSVHMLPTFWKNISMLNPILYMINAFRYGFLGVSDNPMILSFFIIIISNILLFYFCILLLRKGFGTRE